MIHNPELCLQVAEAAGLNAEIVVQHCFINNCAFCPDVNLDDAFMAAERVGLFDANHLGKREDGWHLSRWDEPTGYSYIGGESEPTPSLAVCHAILKLKESEQ